MTKKHDLIGYLAIIILTVVYSWMTERDSHPFNDSQKIEVRS